MKVERLGLVDLGSNTARLVVYEYRRGRAYRLADELREVVRLGEGIARSGRMRRQNMETALAALRSFVDYAKATKLPTLRVLATSAVREARNGAEFARRVLDIGLDAEVVSGDQEAALGVLAVANGTTLQDAWVIDLGGGSMQLSRMKGRLFDHGASYPLGSLRCSEAFLLSDPVRRREVAALEAEVDAQLRDVAAIMRDDPAPVVAMGGTIRNLAATTARAAGHPWPQLHGYGFSTRALEELTERLMSLDVKGRGRIPGVNSYRADTILAGALVYRRLARLAEVPEFWISSYGVREGALFRTMLPAPHLFDDVPRSAVGNLLWRYPQPVEHVERVRHLALRLVDELRPLHDLGEEDRQLLEAAAAVHDIGKAVGYRDHAEHGAYLLAASPLPGFTQRQQALLSLLVRFHRSGKPKPGRLASMLRDDDTVRLRQLTACLRLAEYMERTRSGRIRDVTAHVTARSVKLELCADGVPWAEQWETQRQEPVFRRAFGRELVVEIAAAG